MIRQMLPTADIIDITHDVKPYSSAETCYFFQASQNNFPSGSAHIVLTDLYGIKNQQLLYAFENNQHVFGVDNGIIPELFDEKPFKLYRINKKPGTFSPQAICAAFAETLQELLEDDRSSISQITAEEIVQSKQLRSQYNPDNIVAQVIHIDRFENIILNVPYDRFMEHRKDRKFKIQFPNGDEISKLSQGYNDVHEAEKLAFFNASGYLEIAINHANAAGLFGFKPNNPMFSSYKTMKIIFE
jgi:S-adenosyl-L-methionine hydrolase (adenosine-forming)